MSADNWNCIRCTYENIEINSRCEMCGTPKDVVVGDPWNCTACTYENSSLYSRCEMCNTPRESDMNQLEDLLTLLSAVSPAPRGGRLSSLFDSLFGERTNPIDPETGEPFKDEDIDEVNSILFPRGRCRCMPCNIMTQLTIYVFTRTADTPRKQLLARIMNEVIMPDLTRMGTINISLIGNTNLEEFINQTLHDGNVPVPATQEAIDKLKKIKLEDIEDHKKILLENCATCLNNFQINDEVIELECGHHFHPICFLPWMKENHTCPVCRHSVEETCETKE